MATKSDKILLGAIGCVCIAAMTIACFIVTGRNGTILAAASTAIGGIIGAVIARNV